ncbi:type II secretion system protein [Liquorilactobacillus cacaonum]|nr:type II secretion system protein [Liquorilactobacillus cacaonum]
MRQRSKEGFTLIEVMAVLGIVTFSLVLSIQLVKNRYDEINEGIFWKKFDQSWMHLVTNVPKSNQIGTTTFYNDKVIFTIPKSEKKTLYYPAGLHLFQYKIIKISTSGRVRGDTVVFTSDVTNLKYIISFQLAWGDYRIKKETN